MDASPLAVLCGSLPRIMTRTASRILVALLAVACTACGRPFAEGGSRDLTLVTSLPADAPEILFLRAVLGTHGQLPGTVGDIAPRRPELGEL